MSDNKIEFSQQGIKFSYRKFLSDSAAGYIIILIAIASFYFPIFGRAFLNISLPDNPIAKLAQMSDEFKIFLFILIFLLATPLGMAVNSSSWIFLGWLRLYSIVPLWYQKHNEKSSKMLTLPFYIVEKAIFYFFIDNTKNSFQFDKLKDFYKFDKNMEKISVNDNRGLIEKENFLQYSDLIEETLHIYHPDIKESISHLQGYYIFFRNIALLLIIYFVYVLIYYFINDYWLISAKTSYILIIFIIFIFINFLENMVYYYLSILKIGYILCKKYNKDSFDTIKGNIDEILKCIANNKIK